MQNYSDLCQRILDEGMPSDDRTGVGTLSVFGATLRFDLSKGFPLLSQKKTNFNPIAHELLWFISGETNIRYLKENGVKIWDDWADENGNLGPVYGKQWRDFDGVDQLSDVIKSIKSNPYSRRHLVLAWHPAKVSEMALPPCHYSFQFYVRDGKLSCIFNMRSTDAPIGLPYNIASYALLTHMVARVCGLDAGELVYSGSDVHIYKNQIPMVEQMLKRDHYEMPQLWIKRNKKNIDDFKFSDFYLDGYRCHPFIKIPVAV